VRQRPLFAGDKYREEKTVVIDECSMLTMDDLLAVLEALDLAHVQRLILVGDPNQLPPIGVGRPFADLVASLEQTRESKDASVRRLAGALGELTVEVRASAGTPSDTLKLASWFTREPQPVNADEVLSDLELGATFNDLEICFWKSEDDLHSRLLDQFQKHLLMSSPKDIQGFNRALGINEKGYVPYDKPNGAENFQVLSPLRMHNYGVHELNRWVQGRFRSKELERARDAWGLKLGDEEIVQKDKVIQVRNQRRKAYSVSEEKSIEIYLANGEVGVATASSGKFMNVVFANRPGLSVGYSNKRDFPEGAGVLELAYVLTVHKAQGSEFKVVFVVLPKNCRLISRELLYTALTRSRDRLVLLIEGTDASGLYDFTRPEKSETARRNTNLFQGAVRETATEVPYAHHLIHRTEKGHMVRSKSELVIANMLYRMGVEYEYERLFEGINLPGKRRPDFSFVDPSGDLILWEHLGMMTRDDYRRDWERKREWYGKNDFSINKNLFTTEDDEYGGLDSTSVRKVAEGIKSML
jgi:ATP-dependent exoDNAse (exonuclease V) alpha subunit